MSAWGVQVPCPTAQVCVHLALPTCLRICQFSLVPHLWLLFLLLGTWQFLLHRHRTLCIPKQELKSSPMCVSQLSQFSCGTAAAKFPVQPRMAAEQCWPLSLEISVAAQASPPWSSLQELSPPPRLRLQQPQGRKRLQKVV